MDFITNKGFRVGGNSWPQGRIIFYKLNMSMEMALLGTKGMLGILFKKVDSVIDFIDEKN